MLIELTRETQRNTERDRFPTESVCSVGNGLFIREWTILTDSAYGKHVPAAVHSRNCVTAPAGEILHIILVITLQIWDDTWGYVKSS